LRLYMRESGASINPEAWSSVFFGTPSAGDRIGDIARSL
jgi:hypothetical protein